MPEEFGTPLRCQIAEHEESSTLAYKALSYTWNEPEFPQHIFVCDPSSDQEKPFYITQNLYHGSQRLRTDETRMLWVDALCIDQLNLEEKSHQVAHMGRVYHEAMRVVVCLGEGHALRRTKAMLLGQEPWTSSVGSI